MLKKKIILASQSPRRAQLLTAANIDFVVKPVPVEEDYPSDLPVMDVAAFLAQKKARAARNLLWDDTLSADLLLTADSVVILDGTIYGKPSDREAAIRVIETLSGRVHQVVTGVCLRSKRREQTFSGVANVHFATLDRKEIEYYVDMFQPYDKAGAYAIQEWIGLCHIERIEGTFSNIMGLPMDLVYPAIRDWRD